MLSSIRRLIRIWFTRRNLSVHPLGVCMSHKVYSIERIKPLPKVDEITKQGPGSQNHANKVQNTTFQYFLFTFLSGFAEVELDREIGDLLLDCLYWKCSETAPKYASKKWHQTGDYSQGSLQIRLRKQEMQMLISYQEHVDSKIFFEVIKLHIAQWTEIQG